MVRQKRTGGQYYYEFMSAGKRYTGTCEGCTNKRDAEAYEKRMRDRAAAFAEQKAVDRLMERRRRELTGREGIAIADAFELSLQKPRRRAPSTKVVEQKRSVWQDFAAFMAETHPEAGDLAAVTPSHAEEYIALIRTSGRFSKSITYKRGAQTVTTAAANGAPSARTAALFQTVCAEVFKLLARDAGIAENPFAGIVKPPKSEETREAFTPEELRRIYDNLDDFTRPLFTVAITTALREGDICNLRWREIDFSTRTIRRTMNKTGQHVEIPIADSLFAYLEERRAITGGGEYVFPEHAEMYRSNRTGVSIRVKQFLEGLGIQTTRTPAGRSRAVSVKDLHSCRHTFCYLAGMQGIPLAVVQSIVGHMSPEMTAHYTAHATLEDKRRGIASMPELITAAGAAPRPAALIEGEADSERTALLRTLAALPLKKLRAIVSSL